MKCPYLLRNFAVIYFSILAGFAQTPDYAILNKAFGVRLLVDNNLWDDADTQIAKRLNWPFESCTNTDSSFRLYATSEERVLDSRPYSLALYGKNGVADRISIVFANKGDLAGAAANNYKKQIVIDKKTISDKLVSVLGPAKIDQFGEGTKTREKVERWDWNGHTILLAAPRNEYVAVRVISTNAVDEGVTGRVSDAEITARLQMRIEHRANGDVILKEIPMVNQGPKGYCVPATWERALRYMDIPADMYILAMAAQTDVGGGTYTGSMIAAAREVVARSGRRLMTSGGKITTRSVAKFIDQGMPILWGLVFIDSLDKTITDRSIQRSTTTNWNAYKEMLKPWRKEARNIRTSRGSGHMCMIIGYNANTGEIATSDSWGPQYAERWITEEEANAISQGDFTIISK